MCRYVVSDLAVRALSESAPQEEKNTNTAAINDIIRHFIEKGQYTVIQDYITNSKVLKVVDREIILSLWEHMITGQDSFSSDMLGNVISAIIDKAPVPDNITDEVYDAVLERFVDYRIDAQQPRKIPLSYSGDASRIMLHCIGKLSIHSNSDMYMRYIKPLCKQLDSNEEPPIVQIVDKLYGQHKAYEVFEALCTIAESPHFQAEDWKLFYKIAMDYSKKKVAKPTWNRLMRSLIRSPHADTASLRFLWRYSQLRANILEHPNVDKRHIEQLISELSVGKYQRQYWYKRALVKAIVKNPAVTTVMLTPLLLDKDTKNIVEEAIKSRNSQQPAQQTLAC
jgi:hypothetical protein